jgi:hypothetical protein
MSSEEKTEPTKIHLILCLTIAVLHGSAGVSWGVTGFSGQAEGDLVFGLMVIGGIGYVALRAVIWLFDTIQEIPKKIFKSFEEIPEAKKYSSQIPNLKSIDEKPLPYSQTEAEASEEYLKGRDYVLNGKGYSEGTKKRSPKTTEMGMQLLYRSAEKGYDSAQMLLVYLYFKGKFIEKNLSDAYMWFHICTRNPRCDRDIYHELQDIEYSLSCHMNQEEIAEAKRLGDKWIRNLEERTYSKKSEEAKIE